MKGLEGAKANKDQIIRDLLYYVSSEDESPRMRLYVCLRAHRAKC